MLSNTLDPTPPPEHKRHVVLVPFMSKSHTITLLHLARLLLKRHLSVTIFTTRANRPFIVDTLADTSASIVDLPFPENIPDIPPGIESTDKIPSMSLFYSFVTSTKRMQPDFERALQSLLPHVSFMVSDGFLWWTLESASKFGIPRLVSYGMCAYANSVCIAAHQDRLLHGPKSDTELITVTRFPWIQITRNDFDPPFTDPEPDPVVSEFHMNCAIATMSSFGTIFNSFYELEPVFVDFSNQLDGQRESETKAWCVGPLCLADPVPRFQQSPSNKPAWFQWLDQKREQGRSVLYVAFGSQAEISTEQIGEIAMGLEESKVNFLWVIRKRESELSDGFEERVKGRGIVVRDWVEQRKILMHESVQGFLSHCGWNSVLESICAGVPILAWPMMAEQPLNARMVVEEIKVGLRVETCDGSVRGFVKWEGLKKMVKELMEGELGKEVRKKVKEVAEMARKAMEDGGSSWRALDSLIDKICNCKQ
ncbi:UDP-glycosyltransferase 90A1-like [Ziziphus jujuba]|uniref:Glycosyltransferase n=1 Tax=Ziziphus jujuba TaxID=326968 RepID=A0A6P3ZKL5_ZIZJJ|nr:UDP-glycosyltransferase 90A1-like [Ziziphus jujuba]